MEIQEIKNKKIWEDFLTKCVKCEEKTFLQSWNWGEFNKMMGNKIWRLGINDNQELLGIALIIMIKAKRGKFLLVPYGPLIKQNAKHLTQNNAVKFKTDILKFLLNKLKKIGREEKCWFIRFSPILKKNEENNEIFKKIGFKKAPILAQPEASWKLDITPSEEKLLMGMRKTTRYLIKQAIKNKNLEVRQSYDLKNVEKFSNLHKETAKKHHFVPLSLNYFKKEFSVFEQDGQIILFLGNFQKKIIAFSFVIFWSGISFYHHAALSPKYHKIPIAYLLQWETIKEAKKRGCVLYDFWGYADPKSNHPWAGSSLFKMGFGGQAYHYVKTQDFPLSWKYWLTWLFEKIRKIKRRI